MNTISIIDLIPDFEEEEESGLSDKPWKDNRKSKSKRSKRYSGDDWEEQNRARKKYLKEWEEDLRYAQELANEGM